MASVLPFFHKIYEIKDIIFLNNIIGFKIYCPGGHLRGKNIATAFFDITDDKLFKTNLISIQFGVGDFTSDKTETFYCTTELFIGLYYSKKLYVRAVTENSAGKSYSDVSEYNRTHIDKIYCFNISLKDKSSKDIALYEYYFNNKKNIDKIGIKTKFDCYIKKLKTDNNLQIYDKIIDNKITDLSISQFMLLINSIIYTITKDNLKLSEHSEKIAEFKKIYNEQIINDLRKIELDSQYNYKYLLDIFSLLLDESEVIS